MAWFRVKENVTAFISLLIAIFGLYASFVDTDAEVYLFPRIAAVIIAILAAMLMLKAIMNRETLYEGEPLINWGVLWPFLLIAFVYMIALETVGFYVSSFVTYIAIVLIYGSRQMLDPKRGIFKIVVAIIFMVVLFLLFWKLLHVRTPTGWLI